MSDNTNEIILEVKDLKQSFGDHVVLESINTTVRKGEVIAIIGPSGCGKSTFLKTLNRMNDYVDNVKIEGDVILDGEDIYDSRVDTTLLRKKVGMVFQQPNPFPMSIYDNVAYGPRIHGIKNKKQLDKIVEDSLKAAALYDEVSDRLHSSALGLSGGQQQRLCIARALAVQPEVILLDEPTSALDPEMVIEVLEVMQQLAKEGMTMIVVTHEMGFAKTVADRVIFLENGKIVEENDAKAFYENPKTERAQDFLKKVMH